MRVYIVVNLTKEGAVALSCETARTLLGFGAEVLFCTEMAECLTEDVLQSVSLGSQEFCYSNADVIVTVGGDGTILHEAVHSLAYNTPILGLNLGRCGFLATCEEDEIQEKLKRLVEGNYTLDPRVLLDATIQSDSAFHKNQKEIQGNFALNDVVISKGHTQQAIDLAIYCDDILVESYRGDGVIIATPTGSTAYSLAAGGPIVDAQTMGIVLTAICPHKLRAPSMVFAPTRVIRVVVASSSRGSVLLSCDGKTQVVLQDGESVDITLSDRRVSLVTFSNAAQFEAIDRKLKSKDY